MTFMFVLGTVTGAALIVLLLLITGLATTMRGKASAAAALPSPGQAGYEARVRALLTAPEWPVDRSRAGGVR